MQASFFDAFLHDFYSNFVYQVHSRKISCLQFFERLLTM